MNEYLSPKEFAEVAGVSVQTIYKQIGGRLAPYVKTINGHKRIAAIALKEYYGVEQLSQPESTAKVEKTTENQLESTDKVEKTTQDNQSKTTEQRIDELAQRNKELIIDLDNANNEVSRLREQLAELSNTDKFYSTRITEYKSKRGRRPKASIETRAEIHELRKSKDGDGNYVHSLQDIADQTGMSKTQVFTILKEPEPAGRWYSQDKDGTRQYFPDYRTALKSNSSDIHFEHYDQ